LYFGDFEKGWRASLTTEERRNDATLPLIMLLDNFSELIGTDFFEYTDSETSLRRHCETIYEICNRFPRSIDELDAALSRRELVGKPLAEFVHIFDYHNDRDLYFRKSVEFVRWFCRTWTSRCPRLLDCLTDRQRHRITAALA
jgi:transposase